MCRESEQQVVYIGTYIRIEVENGMIWWLQRQMMGRCGLYMGYCASMLHLW